MPKEAARLAWVIFLRLRVWAMVWPMFWSVIFASYAVHW
jgi:hypothetical protein